MKFFSFKVWCSVAFVLLSTFFVSAQEIKKVEPLNWWVGMNNPELQLMIYGDDIASYTPKIKDSKLEILKVNKVENKNYLFLDLKISEKAKAGKYKIDFLKDGKKAFSHSYELLERNPESKDRKGFNQSDVLYLITPDRFVNGNPKNDNINGMLDTLNRSDKDGRHGGDIAGISNSLEYIKDMGFTAIWLNPVLENNQPKYSYHGYAITDYYKVDSRYGSNEEYVAMIKKAKEMGISTIMDMILNHSGSYHWWMNDIPSQDWINKYALYKQDSFQFTNHMKSTIQDPYVAEKDLDGLIHTWFDKSMPDLNVNNPFMAKYLIQNSIWWVEYADLGGIRMDTYSYPDKEFMTEWTCAVMNEYPGFNIVGEEWNIYPPVVSYWQQDKVNKDGYTSCLRSLMDFPVQTKLVESLNHDKEEWASGWKTLYETLAQDFLYSHPEELVVFPDNHDMSRIYTQVKENYDLYKMAMTFILTTRGVPQLYYGTEILMANPNSEDHGEIRSDFPGGWNGDQVNAFTNEGLTEQQMEAKEFTKRILNWRKDADVIHNGKLIHYAPARKSNLYVFFRYNDDKKVMVILSKRKEAQKLKVEDFAQMISGNEKGVEIISGNKIDLNQGLTIPAMSSMIIEFE